MKTTLEIPDALYRRIKSKSSLEGRPVRAVTQRLYELWLEGRVSLDDPDTTNENDKTAWKESWVKKTDSLSKSIGKKSTDTRLSRELLKDDRR